MMPNRIVAPVLGTPIDVLSWRQATGKILKWAAGRQSRYVTICNVHVTVTAALNHRFRQIICGADMATPDGAPVAWMLHRLGYKSQPRISGPDLMEQLLKECARKGIRIFFYGSSETVLSKLEERLRKRFPDLQVAGMISPPFRRLSAAEDRADVQQINDSGSGIIFVGLGCPKQEQWMADHRDHIKGVMIGVGAAFDFQAGTLQRAPQWMRESGLEWLHRFIKEPRRLAKRYLATNSLFLILALRDLSRNRKTTSALKRKDICH